jgi:hypothetical protein
MLSRRVLVVGLGVALPALAGAQDRRKIVVGFVTGSTMSMNGGQHMY